MAISLSFSSLAAAPAKKGATTKKAPPAPTTTIPKITNLDEIFKDLRLDRFQDRKFNRKIKIAILDNGFAGHEKEINQSLPANTIYHPGPTTRVDQSENTEIHGTFMAALVAAVLKKSGAEVDYELHLFNTQGFTKFGGGTDTAGNQAEGAVRQVAREGFDIVLHSQVWEYGGNGDGAGFVNKVVDQAIAAGLIWINAAGDFGKLTYRGPIETEGDWLKLYQRAEKKKTVDGIRIKCKAPAKENCILRLVLTWNDFKDDINQGTDQDLDVLVCNSKLSLAECETGAINEDKRRIEEIKKANAQYQQEKAAGKPHVPFKYSPRRFPHGYLRQAINPTKDQSRYPRELAIGELNAGTYHIRVRNVSKNFNENSQMKITVSGPGIELVDAVEGETLLPPTDHDEVIVVGASDDLQTSRSALLKRPDVNLKSKVKLAGPIKIQGLPPSAVIEPSTSASAALAAGLAALHLGIDTDRKREPMISALRMVGQKLPPVSKVASTPVPGTKDPVRQAKENPAPTVTAEKKANGKTTECTGNDVASGCRPSEEVAPGQEEPSQKTVVTDEVKPDQTEKTDVTEAPRAREEQKVEQQESPKPDMAQQSGAPETRSEETGRDVKVPPVKRQAPAKAETPDSEKTKPTQKEESAKAAPPPTKKPDKTKPEPVIKAKPQVEAKAKPAAKPAEQSPRGRPAVSAGLNCAIPARLPRLHQAAMDVMAFDPSALTVEFQGVPTILTNYNFRAQYRMNRIQILYATNKGMRVLTPDEVRKFGIDQSHYRVLNFRDVSMCR